VTDAELYDPEFFDAITPAALNAAGALMPFVLEYVQPARVIDVGCGRGPWLRVLHEISGCEILGVDGPHVDVTRLVIPRERFVPHDLNLPLPDLGTFDLAVSMEVAEHLLPERADSFVADLCGLAPTVLFSAAIPGQGGTGHINEQWLSFWASRFADHGYRLFDVLRPRLWNDARIPVHYRQNLILFSRNHDLAEQTTAAALVDVVHPELFADAVATRDRPPGVGDHLRDLLPSVRRSIAYRIRRARRSRQR